MNVDLTVYLLLIYCMGGRKGISYVRDLQGRKVERELNILSVIIGSQ